MVKKNQKFKNLKYYILLVFLTIVLISLISSSLSKMITCPDSSRARSYSDCPKTYECPSGKKVLDSSQCRISTELEKELFLWLDKMDLVSDEWGIFIDKHNNCIDNESCSNEEYLKICEESIVRNKEWIDTYQDYIDFLLLNKEELVDCIGECALRFGYFDFDNTYESAKENKNRLINNLANCESFKSSYIKSPFL